MSRHPSSGGPSSKKPRFAAFLLTGGLVGLVVAFFLSVFGPVDARYDVSAVLGFLGVVCAGLGVLVAGIVAVLLDKRS